jgi:hypothetical protein
LPPAQPAVLEVVDHFDDLSLHSDSFTHFEIYRLGPNCVSQADLVQTQGFRSNHPTVSELIPTMLGKLKPLQ